MTEAIESILSVSCSLPAAHSDMELVQQRVQDIPGSVHYIINRYRKPENFEIENAAMLSYHYKENEVDTDKTLELAFCISGNKYCKKYDEECTFCKLSQSHDCEELVPTIDIAYFKFDERQLSQYVKDLKTTGFTESILNFTHTSSFTRLMPICDKVHSTLKDLMNHPYTDGMANIYTNAQTQMLLLHTMECMGNEEIEEGEFSCKFLENEEDRKKIEHAREVLIQHICDPLTIKELSRKAAINECYLKKGFKELYGTTIFDFFQNQRMEHAKYLLYERGLTVTDVSNMLGYSSISHFSTAFKKHTGLKPCELLLR
ncbi:MAG: helix-turn-helix transcriptional regulator [Chitinophagaceae bacterium]|nr:helix-turn-helix transcriptional regulator [Chitinophagaceae bacterium]